MQDIWEFKDTQSPSYPTEKNLDLLKTIVSASSNEGDLVMDVFAIWNNISSFTAV